MKNRILKSLTIASIALLPLSFTSCDSGPGEDVSSASDAADSPSPSLEPGDILAGDVIIYDTTNADPIYTTIVLNGATTDIGDSDTINYIKTGDYTFTMTLDRQAADRMEIAIQLLMSDPTELGSDFRRILLNPDADFTDEELLRLATLLSAFNAPVNFVEGENKLFFESEVVHTHLVTSTNLERVNGTMGGRYTADASGFVIGYREATEGEFRLITTDHVIPFISDISETFDNIESGTFILDLTNP